MLKDKIKRCETPKGAVLDILMSMEFEIKHFGIDRKKLLQQIEYCKHYLEKIK